MNETRIATPSLRRPVATPDSLQRLYAAIRAATRTPTDWQQQVETVVDHVRGVLPSADDVLRTVPAEARDGHAQSQLLHVEPDGTFSVVALISRPGQATSIHDHTTWCAVAVITGSEYEERFQLDQAGTSLVLVGVRTDLEGTVSGFAPPGDIHRVTNADTAIGISLHIYGTDLNRISNSVRREYDLPIRHVDPSAGRKSG